MRGAGLGDLVGRAPVVPEDLTVRRGEGRDGKRRSAPIRSEEEINALLGQQPRDVLPSARSATCVVEGDEAERAVCMVDPEPDPVVGVLPLAAQRSAHRYRDSGDDRFV